MFEIAITAVCMAYCCGNRTDSTFILGVTDSDEVLIRSAADPDTAPWRDLDFHDHVRVEVHGIQIARKQPTEEDRK